jgi:uncharacterized membrane protein
MTELKITGGIQWNTASRQDSEENQYVPAKTSPAQTAPYSFAQRFFCHLAALFYIGAGFLHFVHTAPYIRIVPTYIPSHAAMVALSGAAEIAGGIGLLIPRLRRAAAWGLVALLIAVFPANVYMATDHIQMTVRPAPEWVAWARLPLQGLLIWWVLWCTGRTDRQFGKR